MKFLNWTREAKRTGYSGTERPNGLVIVGQRDLFDFLNFPREAKGLVTVEKRGQMYFSNETGNVYFGSQEAKKDWL